MCASRVRCARPAAREARANIRAEVISLGNWERFTRHQDKTMSKRDEDIERREAIKKHQAAVQEGAAARRRGIPISANPYRYDPITYTRSGTADFALRAGWDQGWRSAIWPDPAWSNERKDERADSSPALMKTK
jgi:hypothetical protein